MFAKTFSVAALVGLLSAGIALTGHTVPAAQSQDGCCACCPTGCPCCDAGCCAAGNCADCACCATCACCPQEAVKEVVTKAPECCTPPSDCCPSGACCSK